MISDTRELETVAQWTVGGMDCASCAAKIRAAVERLDGAANVRISVISETLKVDLDGGSSTPDDVEVAVRRLGYSISRSPGETASQDAESRVWQAPSPPGEGSSEIAHGTSQKRWFQTGKGKLVVASGCLLAIAWSVQFFASESVGYFAFVAACLIAGFPVARRAVAALRAGLPFTIEMLMTIAVIGALFIDAAEEAALVVFLFAVGEVLEGVAADSARASIRALGDLVPKSALLEENGETRSIEASSLRIGHTILVRPGDRIPADGEITEGISSIDESPITGESVPKNKFVGDDVFAGSINTEAALRVLVTKSPEDNTIARIIRLVEEAQEARAPTERFIDRFSRIYMPVIVTIAILIAIVPPLAFAGDWSIWVYRALALLLIGCPCALVISVPASIASALSAGARHGLLMKGGIVIEAAAKTTKVAFDKTGTLTEGRPEVTDIEGLGYATRSLLETAAGIEAGSSHPLATAVLHKAQVAGVVPKQATEMHAVAGRGVHAKIDGVETSIGSPRFAEESGVMTEEVRARIGELESQGKTVATVFSKESILGLIALRDEARSDAMDAINRLRSLGVSSVMLTGDNAKTAAAIAEALGIDERSQLLPDDKAAAVQEMIRTDQVMMVGDGINDAPALASAHLGVAMGSGTDVALETADGAILRDRVTDVAAMISLSRDTMTNIRQNVVIALGLKGVFLVTTVLGVTGLWIAILADTGATVLVTLNALRLLGAVRAR